MGAATAATVGATNPEVQDAFQNVTTAVGTTLGSVVQSVTGRSCTDDGENAKGGNGAAQVAIVEQRNAAEVRPRPATPAVSVLPA